MGQEILISLGISHTPWVPERVESMRRLTDALRRSTPNYYLGETFSDRCPNWVWSEKMWTWASNVQCTHCLFLQDDTMVAPNFWPALYAMLSEVPDEIIGLESVHPYGMTIARQGGRWYTSADGLIGVGYVIPRHILVEFLAWRSALSKGAVEAITEDTLIDVFAMSTGRRIWHPVPTIIDHDVRLDSTYGNDHHSYRRPSVLWSDGDIGGWLPENLERPEFWAPVFWSTSESVPHLGRFYAGTHWLGKQWDKSWTIERHNACEADVCPEEYGKWV